jgi:hypothetical protein
MLHKHISLERRTSRAASAAAGGSRGGIKEAAVEQAAEQAVEAKVVVAWAAEVMVDEARAAGARVRWRRQIRRWR